MGVMRLTEMEISQPNPQAYALTFHHRAIPQPRPRVYGKRTVDPKSGEKRDLRFQLLNEMRVKRILKPSTGISSFKMSVHLTPPAKWRREAQKASYGDPAQHGPDLDNILKFYMDLLGGIFYDDDREIPKVEASKTYAKNPRVEIWMTFTPIGPQPGTL